MDDLKGVTVARLFEEQVHLRSEAVAVVGADCTLSYGELNRRANRLAHRLRALGVEAEVPVGICVERSPEMVVGLLAILKAGGAYVPLDANYPRERLAFLIADSDPPVLLLGPGLEDALPPYAGTVVPLNSEEPAVGNEDENVERLDDGDGLAYVMYTSGSTGRPKGVEIRHRGIVRLVRDTNYASFSPEETFLQFAPISFDASTLEIWGSLLNGGRLVLMPPGPASLEELARTVEKHDVTTLWLTAGLFHQAVEDYLPNLRKLRQLLAGGDVLSVPHVEKAVRELPGCRVINGYGPTENTTFTCCHLVSPGEDLGASVPIGKPISRTRVYVLDSELNPVPQGESGELCIAGDGLARGYRNDPALTRERFIDSPFPSVEPGRLYRSGDLARVRADGALEFLGRVDQQIKVRGYRIEPGEIEQALAVHEMVRESVVVARAEGGGEKKLVAYVVCESPDARPESEGDPTTVGAGQVEHWQALYEATYGQAAEPRADDFDVVGWNSSYTGGPIPGVQMEEWVDRTVERIRSLRPQRVLEIGCGTGLLLLRIAPDCEKYVGTDFSETAIRNLQKNVSRRAFPHVSLTQREARSFEGLPSGAFDTVIINSVAQYFPSVGYFVEVIRGALGALAPAGRIFLGDLRSLPLLEAFHASVELYKSRPSLSLKDFRRRVLHRLADDGELVISPALFPALTVKMPEIRGVRVLPKRGVSQNELTRFRYDVVLETADPKSGAEPGLTLDWDRDVNALSRLRSILESEDHEAVTIVNVPNGRTAAAATAWRLSGSSDARDLAELRDRAERSSVAAPDPEDFHSLAQELSCRVELSWGRASNEGRFDARFRRGARASDDELRFYVPASENLASVRSWSAYANVPIARNLFERLVPRLRQALEERFPEYMVPSTFVRMDRLPLTPNGKVDRRALPAPGRARPELGTPFLEPRGRLEQEVSGILEEVLDVEPIGANDDFFELGGHSLKAARVISRIRQKFGVTIPIAGFFEAPSVAGLALLVSEAGALSGPPARIPATPWQDKEVPLSFAQERLWFFDQLEPGGYGYNIGRAFRLAGRLNREALSRALSALAERQASLRTAFVSHDGTPAQVIARELTIPIASVDMTAMSPEELEERLPDLLSSEARRPFDLSQPPLLRVCLYRVGEEEHILLLTTHHIVTDGWSMELLYRELGQLYARAATGEGPPILDLPIQYVDVARWQREELSQGALEPSLEYWNTRLASAPPFLDLPSDRPRADKRTTTPRIVSRLIDAALLAEIHRLGRREGATLFMTLLASFNILLSRLSGVEDIVVGSPMVERTRPETEDLIGLFLNSLALRTDLTGNPTFVELLAQVRTTALEAFEHQDVPFEKVVERLQPPRDLSRPPIFQFLFNVLNYAASGLKLSGLRVEPLTFSEVGFGRFELEADSRFDMTLYASEEREGLRFRAVYNAALFEEARVVEMLNQLSTLLEQIVAAPEQRIGAYSLLTGSARKVLPDPTAPIAEPEMPTAAESVLAWSERAGSAPAVAEEGRVWTYADLARSSQAVAERLLAQGLMPGDVVAVGGRRSFGLIASLLGVLRSGGVLLTLDPALPPARRKLMFEESRGRHALRVGETSKEPFWDELSDLLPVDIRDDGGFQDGIFPRFGGDLPLPSGNDPAYVFFTSGTSGVPKAVLGCHKGLSHFLRWQRDTFKIGPGDRCAQLTGLSFDVVLRDIFLPLTSGATLHLPAPDRDIASEKILSWFEEEGITAIHTVPSVAQSWLAAVPAGARLRRLRWAFFAGEPLTDTVVRRWFAAFPGAGRAVNLYGPTETTLAKCFFPVPEDPPGGIQPVGGPLPNTQVLLLNPEGGLCGVGEVGEIGIRTPFRTLGYVNTPEEQRRRFVTNPFRGEESDLIYRTGDRGRYRLDGTVSILGRTDDQVKVRGVRVEPAEVAAVLSRLPGVEACAVVSRKDEKGEIGLVAYVVSSARTPETTAGLRGRLSTQLPAALVPSAFVFLEKLPLTPNGKLDRSALPAPDFATEGRSTRFEPPRTPVEEVVASIWTSILGVDRVGVHDNFFELGGHSLKATQVISRLGDAFALSLPVRLLFEAPTLEGLSTAIEDLLVEELQRTGSE
ncbi:MAG: amino acid adenylation domain-containing protein [Thermoanaerobaculia bacterium]